MKLIDNKCPYCSSVISEKPGQTEKQVNCSGCGRLLVIDPIDKRRNSAQLKSIEPGFLLTGLIGCSFATENSLILFITIIFASIIICLLWSQENLNFSSKRFNEILISTEQRLKIFPFELYLIPLWLIIGFLYIMSFYRSSFLLYNLVMLLAGYIAIQANRFLRESKITSSQTDIKDFSLFIAIMLNPSTAFNRKKNNNSEQFTEQHFYNAAAEKEKKDKIVAADYEEISRKREIKQKERKIWEADIESRYEQWLEEEATRLRQEKKELN